MTASNAISAVLAALASAELSENQVEALRHLARTATARRERLASFNDARRLSATRAVLDRALALDLWELYQKRHAHPTKKSAIVEISASTGIAVRRVRKYLRPGRSARPHIVE